MTLEQKLERYKAISKKTFELGIPSPAFTIPVTRKEFYDNWDITDCFFRLDAAINCGITGQYIYGAKYTFVFIDEKAC